MLVKLYAALVPDRVCTATSVPADESSLTVVLFAVPLSVKLVTVPETVPPAAVLSVNCAV